jgi:hypothetical protein
MVVKVTHTVHNGGVEGLMNRLNQIAKQKVAVGVPADTNERKGDKIGNAYLMYIQTNGVRPRDVRAEMKKNIDKGTKYTVALQMYLHEHGSFVYQIPARPVIQPAILDKKEALSEGLKIAAVDAMNGNDYQNDLIKVGSVARDAAKDWFTNSKNGWAPNAPSTIKRKGSDSPLIDTKALQQSITYKIRGDD